MDSASDPGRLFPLFSQRKAPQKIHSREHPLLRERLGTKAGRLNSFEQSCRRRIRAWEKAFQTREFNAVLRKTRQLRVANPVFRVARNRL
jgi:hypothetical protein